MKYEYQDGTAQLLKAVNYSRRVPAAMVPIAIGAIS